MAKLVTALFQSGTRANIAVDDLVRHGYPCENVSLMGAHAENGRDLMLRMSNEGLSGASIGTISGALLGFAAAICCETGLIHSHHFTFLIYPVYLVALAFVAVGGAIGFLLGAVGGLGTPRYEAFVTGNAPDLGRILIAVYLDHETRFLGERLAEVRKVLDAAGGKAIATTNIRPIPLSRPSLSSTEKLEAMNAE